MSVDLALTRKLVILFPPAKIAVVQIVFILLVGMRPLLQLLARAAVVAPLRGR